MSEHDLNLQDVAKAVEEINKTWDAQKKAIDELEAETKKFGSEMPETKAKLDKMEADMVSLGKKLDQAVLAQKRRERVVTDEHGNEIDLDVKAAEWAKFVSAETKASVSEFKADELDAYKGAFMSLVRKNFQVDLLSEAERKSLSVGVDSAGGYFVYPDLTGRIAQRVYETSPVRAYANVQMISGDALEGYYDNDEVGYGWVSELATRSETTTPTVGKWRIPVYEMYAMPKASQKILDDSIIDMENWLDHKIADKFARAENNGFVVGDGDEKPKGFMTYPDGTDLTNSIEQVVTGVSGDFEAAGTSGECLITAIHKLKAPYRANATWFMNTTTQGAVRKLKDTTGQFLWNPSIAAGQPSTLLGRPIATFEDMADIAVNSLSIAVGDLQQAYQVVDRFGIRMLRDPYTTKGSVLFYATKRTGGDMINGEALKIIKFST